MALGEAVRNSLILALLMLGGGNIALALWLPSQYPASWVPGTVFQQNKAYGTAPASVTGLHKRPVIPLAKGADELGSVAARGSRSAGAVPFATNHLTPMAAHQRYEVAALQGWVASHRQGEVISKGDTDTLSFEGNTRPLMHSRAVAAAGRAAVRLPSEPLLTRPFGERLASAGPVAAPADEEQVPVCNGGSGECPQPPLDDQPGMLMTYAEAIAAGLRRSRNLALADHRPSAFVVDVNARQFANENGQPPHQLPASIDLALYTARSELTDESVGAIRFFPDGTSTGGQITLEGENKRYVIDVAWLTGEIRVLHEGGPLP